MIIATMQGLKHDEGSTTSLDGRILEGDEKKDIESQFYFKTFKKANIPEKEGIYVLNETEVLCQIFHNQKDNSGRKVFVCICYDYPNDECGMFKVAKAMDFDYEKFLKIKNDNAIKIKILTSFYRMLSWVKKVANQCYGGFMYLKKILSRR